jgi:polysaccharide biosynthesis transport protein
VTNTTKPDRINHNDEELASIDVRRYIRVVVKHKWVVAATVAVIITGTVLYTLGQPKIYEATATMVIDPRPPEILGGQVQEIVQMGTNSWWWNQEYYNTQIEILTSRALIKQTVTNHDLHHNPKIVGAKPNDTRTNDELIDQATSALMGALHVAAPEQNRIVDVVFRHTDPDLAAFLANAHVETYIQYNLNLRVEGTEFASKWLTDVLDTAETELRNSELDLFQFKKDNDILSVSLEDRKNLVAGNIEKFTEALNDARTHRIKLSALRARIREAANVDVLESPIFELSEGNTGTELKAQYYQERHRLFELAEELGPKHPDFVVQKKKVDDLFAALQREAKVLVQSIEQKHQAALQSEADFEKEVERYKAEAFELGPKEVDYNRLARREKSNEEKYDIVLGRLRTSDLTGRLTTVNVRPLDPALVPTAPVFPNMQKNVLLAALMSLGLGVGLAFLLDALDRTIKTAEDVQAATAASLLGIIPAIDAAGDDRTQQKNKDLHVHLEPTSRTAECCRSIRTNLLFMAADDQLNTIVVSSASPREGKSTTVLHLGTSMAQSGQRILLIDSDMRRPRLHQSLGVSRAQGLSNLIVGDARIDDVVKTTDVPNLYILPCGPTPPNPAELLMTQSFRDVLAQLGQRFDRILLDSPPLLAVTDAAVLSQIADGIILVAKAGVTHRDQAQQSAQQLRSVDARIVGVILNELDLEDRSYGYYYQYYAYGYSSKDQAGAQPTATT